MKVLVVGAIVGTGNQVAISCITEVWILTRYFTRLVTSIMTSNLMVVTLMSGMIISSLSWFRTSVHGCLLSFREDCLQLHKSTCTWVVLCVDGVPCASEQAGQVLVVRAEQHLYQHAAAEQLRAGGGPITELVWVTC
jgi:hypothetical protein